MSPESLGHWSRVATGMLCALLGVFGCNSSDGDSAPGSGASTGSAGRGSGNGGSGGATGAGGTSGAAGRGGRSAGGTAGLDAVAGEGGRSAGAGGDGGANPLGGSSGEGGEGGEAGSTTPQCPPLSGDPVVHASETISEDQQWSGWHQVEGELNLQATLELAPCTVVAFGNGAVLHVFVDGSLQAKGVEGEPVLFTSAKASPKPGDWLGIQVGVESLGDSLLEHAIIEYGGTMAFALNANATAGLAHVVVRHTADAATAIYLAGRPSRFEQVRTEDSAQGLLVDANVVGSLGSFSSDGPPIRVASNTVTTDGVWHDFGVPYLLLGGFSFEAHIGIDPGVVIEMANQGQLNVIGEGVLEAIGTEDRPIRFTSSKVPPAPGDWSAIGINYADDNASRLEHVILEYGGHGNHSLEITPGSTVTLSHVTVTHNTAADCAIYYAIGAFVGPFEHVDMRGNAFPLCVPFSEVGNLGSLAADEGAVVLVGPETSTVDATWRDLGPAYRVQGTVNVQADLAIEAGVTVQVAHGSSLQINGGGTFTTLGTDSAPVTFQSTLDSPASGDWQQINISSDAGPLNSLTHTLIEDGGWNATGALVVNMHAVPFDHVTLENNGACDVSFLNDGTVLSDLSSSYVPCP